MDNVLDLDQEEINATVLPPATGDLDLDQEPVKPDSEFDNKLLADLNTPNEPADDGTLDAKLLEELDNEDVKQTQAEEITKTAETTHPTTLNFLQVVRDTAKTIADYTDVPIASDIIKGAANKASDLITGAAQTILDIVGNDFTPDGLNKAIDKYNKDVNKEYPIEGVGGLIGAFGVEALPFATGAKVLDTIAGAKAVQKIIPAVESKAVNLAFKTTGEVIKGAVSGAGGMYLISREQGQDKAMDAAKSGALIGATLPIVAPYVAIGAKKALQMTYSSLQNHQYKAIKRLLLEGEYPQYKGSGTDLFNTPEYKAIEKVYIDLHNAPPQSVEEKIKMFADATKHGRAIRENVLKNQHYIVATYEQQGDDIIRTLDEAFSTNQKGVKITGDVKKDPLLDNNLARVVKFFTSGIKTKDLKGTEGGIMANARAAYSAGAKYIREKYQNITYQLTEDSPFRKLNDLISNAETQSLIQQDTLAFGIHSKISGVLERVVNDGTMTIDDLLTIRREVNSLYKDGTQGQIVGSVRKEIDKVMKQSMSKEDYEAFKELNEHFSRSATATETEFIKKLNRAKGDEDSIYGIVHEALETVNQEEIDYIMNLVPRQAQEAFINASIRHLFNKNIVNKNGVKVAVPDMTHMTKVLKDAKFMTSSERGKIIQDYFKKLDTLFGTGTRDTILRDETQNVRAGKYEAIREITTWIYSTLLWKWGDKAANIKSISGLTKVLSRLRGQQLPTLKTQDFSDLRAYSDTWETTEYFKTMFKDPEAVEATTFIISGSNGVKTHLTKQSFNSIAKTVDGEKVYQSVTQQFQQAVTQPITPPTIQTQIVADYQGGSMIARPTGGTKTIFSESLGALPKDSARLVYNAKQTGQPHTIKISNLGFPKAVAPNDYTVTAISGSGHDTGFKQGGHITIDLNHPSLQNANMAQTADYFSSRAKGVVEDLYNANGDVLQATKWFDKRNKVYNALTNYSVPYADQGVVYKLLQLDEVKHAMMNRTGLSPAVRHTIDLIINRTAPKIGNKNDYIRYIERIVANPQYIEGLLYNNSSYQVGNIALQTAAKSGINHSLTPIEMATHLNSKGLNPKFLNEWLRGR